MENKLKKLRSQSDEFDRQGDIVIELRDRGIKITKAYYSMIETGKRRPNPNIMKALADIFNTTIEDIFFDNTTNVSLDAFNQKPA